MVYKPWFNEQNFDARMSQTQINQMFNQKDMPADLKKRYAQKIITIRMLTTNLI